jgi:hypothetical protein
MNKDLIVSQWGPLHSLQQGFESIQKGLQLKANQMRVIDTIVIHVPLPDASTLRQ